MKGNGGFTNPYNPVKSSDNMGTIHGSGIPGQRGTRYSTFTYSSEFQKKPGRSPPKKMN